MFVLGSFKFIFIMAKTYFSFTFIFSFTLLNAQMGGLIRGKVVDALTREPVIAATLIIEGSTGGHLQTDTSGAFFCPVTSGQSVLIKVHALGYTPWHGTLNDPSRESIIWLSPVDQELEGVVISATMKEVSKDASPIPVELYTPRFLQRSATSGVFDALSAVNGVRPQITCGVCNTGSIQINGMPGPYTMVTMDGMPVVSGLSTVYGLSGIPNGLVERIEVIKGPAGTIFGSEAVAGVINVVTKNASRAPVFYADVFGSSYGESNIETGMSAKLKRVHTLLGIHHYRFQQRHDINQDQFTDMALQHRLSVFNKWQWQRKYQRIAMLAARYVAENRWGGEMNWAEKWRGSDQVYGESILTHRVEVLGKYQLPVKSRRVTADISWNLHDQDAAYGASRYIGKQQVAFSQLTSDVPLGKSHDALVGLAVRYTRYDDNTPATASSNGNHNLPDNTWLPGIFFQDEVQWNARHTTLLGLRYDYQSAHGSIFTPRISWKWTQEAQQVLRVTAGSGYRVANIFTEEHAALSGAREVVIARALHPERSWNVNVNYSRKFFPPRAGVLGMDGSLFYTYFTNQIVPDYLSDASKIIFDNLNGYAISAGAALNADYSGKNGLKINTGVTLLRAYRKEEAVRQPQLFAPALSGTWSISAPVSRLHCRLDYTGTWNSPMHLPVVPDDYRPEQSPWYSLHHIQVTYTLTHDVEIYAGVKNLLGFYPREDVILRAFDPFDRSIAINNPGGYQFDPSYSYAPVQRQRLLLGVRWTFHEH